MLPFLFAAILGISVVSSEDSFATENISTIHANVSDAFNSTNVTALACGIVMGEDGGFQLAPLWYVGVTMSIIASMMSNAGLNVQKYSMMQEFKHVAANKSYKERMYLAQPLWWIGLFCVIMGSVGDFAALGFAAQSLVTPVGGFTMVANIFFVPSS